MSNRRVIHIINGEHFAGAERVQDLLGTALPEHGFDCTFVSLMRGRFAETVKDRDYEHVSAPMRGRLGILQSALQISKIARERDACIIHAHTIRSGLVAALVSRITGIPLVLHVHSPSSSETDSRIRNLVHVAAERVAGAQAAHFICVSNSLRERLTAAGTRPDRVSVVHNGIAATPRPAPKPHRDHLCVGMVALLRPRKGVEVLLKSLARLDDSVQCTIVGPFETPTYEREVLDLVKSLNLVQRVKFTGHVSDVERWWKSFDIFALPSLFGEGVPMVCLEAMAHGTPVVSTQVEGLPELISSDAEGLLVAPDDVPAFTGALRTLVESRQLRHDIAEAAFVRQSTGFTQIAMASGVAAVYRSTLSERRDDAN